MLLYNQFWSTVQSVSNCRIAIASVQPVAAATAAAAAASGGVMKLERSIG